MIVTTASMILNMQSCIQKGVEGMKRVGVCGVLVGLFAFLVGPVMAQSSGLSANELEALALVQNANDIFKNLESFFARGEMNIAQHMLISQGGIDTQVNTITLQVISGPQVNHPDGSLSAIMKLQQEVSIDNPVPVDLSQTMEMVIVDGDLYIQVHDVEPAFAAAVYPVGWVNLTENPDIPAFATINAGQFANTISSSLLLDINEATIASITELEPDTINGQLMNVINLVYDVQALYSQPEVALGLGLFDTSQLGFELQPGDLPALIGEDATIDLTVWIGFNDRMLHRFDMNMDMVLDMTGFLANANIGLPAGTTATMNQQMNWSFVYSAFNEEFEIVAPIDD